MSFESELKAHIDADGTVTGLIQSRFHPVRLPEGVTLPAATYQRVGGGPRNSLDGFTNGLTNVLLQIDIWARTPDAAREIAAAISARMNTMTTTLRSVLQSEDDDYEPETKLFRIIQQYSCWHSQ